MVWSIATSSFTTTITPDGTTDADLITLLDTAIAGSQLGISKLAEYAYYMDSQLVIASDPGGVNWLYMSGMHLFMNGDPVTRNAGSRVKITDVNAAGATVGPFTFTNYGDANYTNRYNYAGSLWRYTDALIEATRMTFSFRNRTSVSSGSGRSVFNTYTGEFTQSTASSYTRCIFESDIVGSSNSFPVFYVDAANYSDCIIRGFGNIELASNSLFKNNTIETSPVYGNAFGDSFLELVTGVGLYLQNVRDSYLTDCTFTQLYKSGPNGLGIGRYSYLRNSMEMLGSTNEASGLFVARTSGNTQIYKRTFSGSGTISGGNAKGATTSSASSERLIILTARFDDPSYGLDYRGTWEGVFVKYGRLPVVFSYNLQGTLATKQSAPFASSSDNYITVSNSATVAAYTEFAIAHNTGTVTISTATTTAKLHDYSALEKASFADSDLTVGSNAVPKCCLPTLGTAIYSRSNGVFAYNLILAANVTGSDRIVLAASKNLTLTVSGDYSTTKITMGSSGVITLPSGATNLQNWIGVGNTINCASGSATVTVDALQFSNFTAGTGVTIAVPTGELRLIGLPTVANTIMSVKDLTSNVTTYPTVTAGEVTLTVNTARNYLIKADAPGYLKQEVELSGTTTKFTFGLTDYRSLYESGSSLSGQIAFDYNTLIATINDDNATLSFADVFRTIEDYLVANVSGVYPGLLYTAHPYPVVLPDRNILWFPLDAANGNAVNPFRVKPDPTNTSDPTLLFEVYLEGGSDPTYSLFDFTSAGGRIIRTRSVVAIAQGTGLDAAGVRGAIGLASANLDTQLTGINTNIDQIPLTPLLTGDSRLNNLDAAISSRSTYAGGDTSGTTTLLSRLTSTRAGLLDNLDAAISSRSTYAGADTSGTTTLLSRLTGIRAGLLDNLDAAISTRSTYSGSDTSGTTTLLSRLTGTRAGYLDNLNFTYVAPDNADIATIKTAVLAIPSNPLLTNDSRLNSLDAAISSRLAASSYVVPINGAIASIQTIVEDLSDLRGFTVGHPMTANSATGAIAANGKTVIVTESGTTQTYTRQ